MCAGLGKWCWFLLYSGRRPACLCALYDTASFLPVTATTVGCSRCRERGEEMILQCEKGGIERADDVWGKKDYIAWRYTVQVTGDDTACDEH